MTSASSTSRTRRGRRPSSVRRWCSAGSTGPTSCSRASARPLKPPRMPTWRSAARAPTRARASATGRPPSCPNDQGQLIREVARVNPRTIVVLQTGGPAITTGWDGSVRAILENWDGGEEQGAAIAEVLWGDVNPSGSLPVSFPRSDRQTPITFRGDPLQYPEVNDQTEYKEGVFIGYRGHEEFRMPPRWSFGHGISYTRFRYSRLRVRGGPQTPSAGHISISFRLRNTGPRRGTEIAQVYTGRLPATVQTPPRQLAGWARATLDPGESQRV